MRKTIFEQIKESITFATEIKRLDTLIRDKNGIRLEAPKEPFIVFDDEVSFISLENFFDTFMFMTWKARGTCISCDDMRKTLHLDDILASEDPSFEETITYCEYVGNLIKLYDKAELREGVHVYRTIVTEAIADNLNYILGWLNKKWFSLKMSNEF